MGNKAGKLERTQSSCGPLGPARKDALIRSLLLTIQQELVRLAEVAVVNGDRFYSVAIIRKSHLSLVVSGRDKTKTKDPTATAELNAIQAFFEEIPPYARPDVKDCIFLCVHEPSPVAMCQIAQSGFDNFVFLFSHEESKSFGGYGPHIDLSEIFIGATPEESYNKENAYWTAYPLGELIESCEKREGHLDIVKAIKRRFKDMVTSEAALAPQTPDKLASNP